MNLLWDALPAAAPWLLPWVLLGFFLAFLVRLPRPLPPLPEGEASRPFVSVIVPARNEAHNIGRCVSSLAAQQYPNFEIVVVDDGSTDGTGALARAVGPGTAQALRVVDGRPLPEGWFGKPWACATGAAEARGEILLFTDADTQHHPELLSRAVAALEEDAAQALSLVGSQEMGTFWERLIQPQIFVLIGMRFPRLNRVVDPPRWRDAIANGQFILVRREPYEALGGHAAVRGEVVEDLRLAQELTRNGGRLTVRGAVDLFSTRMYTSLRELVDGWTKNVATGARQSAVGWAPLALPGIVTFLLGVWVLPPVLFLSLAGVWLAGGSVEPALLLWSGITTGFALSIWLGAYSRMGAPAPYGLLFPLGALMVLYIVLRSQLRGRRRIEWKGRRYGGTAVE
jgi:chlorobactene glucosyltransferase